MDHYFPDVPGLGNIAVSRHAQARMQEDGISEAAFRDVLMHGDTVPDGQDVVWRQKDGIRIRDPAEAGAVRRRHAGQDGVPHRRECAHKR